MTREHWKAAKKHAAEALARNAAQIDAGQRGIPSGRTTSRRPPDADGWRTIPKTTFGGRCETCGTTIKPGVRAKWKAGVGIKHVKCPSAPRNRRSVTSTAQAH